MVDTVQRPAVTSLPLAPKNPLPYRQRLEAARDLAAGPEMLRDAGGQVTRNILGPKWLLPPFVVVTSPQGARDVLGRKDADADRGPLSLLVELRRVVGGNLLNLPHDEWLPRKRALQPLFTKQHVVRFAGEMTQAAEQVCARWSDGDEVDLSAEAHTLTLRALGRSVLGLDLDERAEAVGPMIRTAFKWAADRALRPIRAPRWLPTPGRRRALEASAALHRALLRGAGDRGGARQRATSNCRALLNPFRPASRSCAADCRAPAQCDPPICAGLNDHPEPREALTDSAHLCYGALRRPALCR